jgi:hypothetical protein
VPVKQEKVIDKDRIVNVPGEDKIVIEKVLEIVEVPVKEVQYLETIQEIMKPVEYVIEKVVERLIERERPVAVPVLQEKLVKEIEYQIVPENNPILVTKYEILKEIREKLVEFIQTKQEIV